jgi:hypothetical protein
VAPPGPVLGRGTGQKMLKRRLEGSRLDQAATDRRDYGSEGDEDGGAGTSRSGSSTSPFK